jgi:hypothetical protein
MKRKKIVGIITGCVMMLTLVSVSLAAAMGSGAYFQDTATHGENYITVGTLDLTTNPSSGVIAVGNIAPGWNYQDSSHWGYTPRYDVRVKNTGTLPLKYRMKAEVTGDGTTFDDALLESMLASVHVEDGKGGIVTIFKGHLKDLFNWHTIYTNFETSGHESWYGKGQNIRIGLAVPHSVGNEIMGQSIQFNLLFEATQTTNPAW